MLCVLVAACNATGSARLPRLASGAPLSGPSSTVPPAAPGSAGFVPAPDSPIPTDPTLLAAVLEEATAALRGSIDAWIHDGDPSRWPPPRPVVLQALYQQRVYGTLAHDRQLARRVIARIPRGLAREAQANVTAGAELLSLVRPVKHPVRFRTHHPLPADVLLGYYQEAQRRFGVAWNVLAAVNYIESKFGRVTSASSAGAQGPMQFLPSTWAVYGMGGDLHDPHDAILGAANYLYASGAPGDYRRALYAYNPARPYVDAVMLYAGQMLRDPRNFYAYYNWQVFVVTPSGERRLTGPGL